MPTMAAFARNLAQMRIQALTLGMVALVEREQVEVVEGKEPQTRTERVQPAAIEKA